MGTAAEMSVPLMSNGLDSLAMGAFASALALRLRASVTPADLFDHPTLDSITSFIRGQLSRNDAERTRVISSRQVKPE